MSIWKNKLTWLSVWYATYILVKNKDARTDPKSSYFKNFLLTVVIPQGYLKEKKIDFWTSHWFYYARFYMIQFAGAYSNQALAPYSAVGRCKINKTRCSFLWVFMVFFNSYCWCEILAVTASRSPAASLFYGNSFV